MNGIAAMYQKRDSKLEKSERLITVLKLRKNDFMLFWFLALSESKS
jgi:hypothetical protein